ncbi:MAG: mannose-6-phosphate isomerase, class I [Spirochaetia bacterium]|nr:mannose-6-phosphate isomerase, class I [Spirochaetia bacterium]
MENFSSFYKLVPAEKYYSWGSHTEIQKILGKKSDGRPLAEIWMGSHPAGMTGVVLENGSVIPMDQFIRLNAGQILGNRCCDKFHGIFPFLFKLLAAEKPLSFQVHPDAAHAAEGFEREERNGILSDDCRRCYKDQVGKREIVIAITPFLMMSGFQPVENIKRNFCELLGKQCKSIFDFEYSSDNEFYKMFFDNFLKFQPESFQLDGILPEPADRIFRKLVSFYPGDKFVLAPLFLNCYELLPGQSMSTMEGHIHSYVHGTCFEVMTPSDNTLRCGLTDKFVNIPEVQKILDYDNCAEAGDIGYDFRMIHGSDAFFSDDERTGAEILFVYSGNGRISNSLHMMELRKGDAILVPAAAGSYTLAGGADFMVARVGVKGDILT